MALLLICIASQISVVALSARGRGESGSQTSAEEGEAEIDYLGIAAIMLRDGNYDRALAALDQYDRSAEGANLMRYYTLRGLVSLSNGDYDAAVEELETAVANGQTDPAMDVYLAQAHYGAQRYSDAVAAIDRIDDLQEYPSLLGVKSQSLWETEDYVGAFTAISEAVELFPERDDYFRQRILYLIELELYQAAAEESLAYLERVDDPEAYLAVGESMRRAGQPGRAIRTLEIAKLRYPDNERVRLGLARAYLDNGQPFVAARLVEQAAAYNSELYSEAAELYRRAGELERALYMNSLVIDQTVKATQRFNLLISLSRYEEARALESRLERLGVLDTDALRYAMAYVNYRTQHFEEASEYISQITDDEYFRQAAQLRRAIESVRAQEIRYF